MRRAASKALCYVDAQMIYVYHQQQSRKISRQAARLANMRSHAAREAQAAERGLPPCAMCRAVRARRKDAQSPSA